MPDFIKDGVNAFLGPVTLFIISVVAFVAMIRWRAFWTRGSVALGIALGTLLVFLLSLDDSHFRWIVSRPDNVAITLMFALLGFFLWVGFRKMTVNDGLLAGGQPTIEGRETDQRVFCWPDLLYSEFLCLIFVTVLLILWSCWIEAPLEQPGHPTQTPNPSKAPWYFVGLQEMLVYFDPWLAGVTFPALIIFGLLAIPYLDTNPRGNGYYTFSERPFAITVFLFGFLILWILLIGLGTFFRGPNWEFYSFYEPWDIHRTGVEPSVSLSDYVYTWWLAQTPPSSILLRELPGLVLLGIYTVLVPFILLRTAMKPLYRQLGGARSGVLMFLLLAMGLLPLKMILRLALDLKYIVSIPEWFFNI